MSRGPGELAHLARRFADHAASVRRPSEPPPAEVAWAHSWLRAGEVDLWDAQAAVDRVHSLAVSHRVVESTSSSPPPRWVVAAALLHDVGKADAPLGLTGRTAATLLELAHLRAAPGALGRYLRYPETGAGWLAAVGSDPRVVAWAREHHRPPPRRSGAVPAAFADLLADADRRAGRDPHGGTGRVAGGDGARPPASAALEQPDGVAGPAQHP